MLSKIKISEDPEEYIEFEIEEKISRYSVNLADQFEYKGYPCVILYHSRGTLGLSYYCGYVGLSKDSKWFGVDYDEIPVMCHGGLTYGRSANADNQKWEPDAYCDKDLYWIGFDCAHAWDDPIKCDLIFCKEECKSIIDQLEDIKKDAAD